VLALRECIRIALLKIALPSVTRLGDALNTAPYGAVFFSGEFYVAVIASICRKR